MPVGGGVEYASRLVGGEEALIEVGKLAEGGRK